MKALWIGAINLKRLTRDRVGLFFIFVFPIVLILLIGVSFGGDFTPRLGIVSRDSGRLGAQLVVAIADDPALETQRFEESAALVDAVERGVVEAGIVVPAGYDDDLRSDGIVEVDYVARPGDLSAALRSSVDAVVADQAARVRAARVAVAQGTGGFEEVLARAGSVSQDLPGIEVNLARAGNASADENFGRFDLGAATQLVLFMFVNSLGGSVALIQSRRLGVSRRMLSTPLRARTVLLGEAAGRFFIAMIQGVFIVIAAVLVFGVSWGDPLAASVLVVAFALVSTGAAVLFGSLLSNEQQAGALTPLGLGLAALGGCMVPLEIFSPTMQTIARVTPHAWAVEGFTELIRNDASLIDVLPQVAVLGAFAAVLVGAASWRLGKAIMG